MSTSNEPTIKQKSLKELNEECCKTYPQYVTCDSCSKNVVTHVENKLSIPSIITCYCCGCCWSIYHFMKKKDLNIWDAEHTCRDCNKEIYSYKSC